MVKIRKQSQIAINQFSNLSTNQQVKMADSIVNYFLSPFEGNINTRYLQGLKLYLQATKEIVKETDKVDISGSFYPSSQKIWIGTY